MSDGYTDLVTTSFEVGNCILARRPYRHRKENGQFLTPPSLARFMSRQLGNIEKSYRILDPAAGSGTLICAVLDRLVVAGRPLEVWVDGYEIDAELSQAAAEILDRAVEQAARRGIMVHAQVLKRDFILDSACDILPIWRVASDKNSYHCIIANPPYFKLNHKDPRVKAVSGHLKGHTNIYTLFMALAVKKLLPGGRASFVVPRSFCSGVYFSDFRRDFVEQAVPLHIHLFESRQDAFKRDAVLQENVVVTFCRKEESEAKSRQPEYLSISASRSLDDLDVTPASHQVSIDHFVHEREGILFFRLPITDLDEEIVQIVDSWQGSLLQYGLSISTGPIVPFRARSFLADTHAVVSGHAVPLFWMQNVKQQRLKWPVNNGNKSQGFVLTEESSRLLVPAANYVLLRRFSAKEERRRLIAAPFLAHLYPYKRIGLENHLNYIYREHGQLETEEAVGLSALLNSGLIDRYFRITNGNTQVNAAELRVLPLPPLQLIKQIGQSTIKMDGRADPGVDVDEIVVSALKQYDYLSPGFPVIRETRV